MKRIVQQLVRNAHRFLLNPGLPPKLGLYLHNIEAHEVEGFRVLVDFCRSHGYRFVDPLEFVNGEGRLVFLSFDDNYVGWYEALPLLEELDVRATFYTNTAPFRDLATPGEIRVYFDERLRYDGDCRVPLSTDELRHIRRAGHAVGAHTHNHPVLSALSPEEAKKEISLSKTILEDTLQEPVVHFSFPYGMRRHFSSELREYCKRIGFETVANATPGLQHAAQRAYSIERTGWRFDRSAAYNETSFSIDGRWYERVTGRSAVG